jgi:hypothetical protein
LIYKGMKMSSLECPICKSKAIEEPKTFDGIKLNCSRCGNFSISGTALAIWQGRDKSAKQVANSSGWIREHQGIAITSYELEALLTLPTPTVLERANKILLAIFKLSDGLSYRFNIDTYDIDTYEFWLAVSYSENYADIDYLFRIYLNNELNYLNFEEALFADGNFSFVDIYITPSGYSHIDSLSDKKIDSQIGFCAMWFSQDVLPIWTDAIAPAIKNSGHDPKRIDSHQHNNRIDDEIIAMIRRSKFVVADFTGQRGGVYFEAGFALGLGQQVIWTCKKSELHNVHFDNRQYNFILWEDDKLEDFKVALQNRIEATIGRGSFQ